MLVFPQLSTGASVQYPVGRQISQRSIQCKMEDGTLLAMADGSAYFLKWRIELKDLSDQEATVLTDFFAETQGNLRPFVFLDPTTNLLLWTEDFTKAAWTTSGVTLNPSAADPYNGSRATRVINATSSSQSITQVTQIPGLSQTCFSIFLRSASPIPVTLVRTAGSQTASIEVEAASDWTRVSLSNCCSLATDSSRYGINIPGGSTLEVFGPQVDGQKNASPYLPNNQSTANVFPNARFDMNQLDITAVGPNRNACVLEIRSRIPAGEPL